MNKRYQQFLSTSLFLAVGMMVGLFFWLKSQQEFIPEALAPTATGGVIIDLMVVYNSAADTMYSNNARTRINHLVDVSNQIYQDSGVNLSLRLVHTEKVNYEAAYNSETAVNHLTSQSHPAFANIPSLRAQYGADLVVLMRPYADDGYCGLAWIGGNGTKGDFSHPNEAEYGYSHVSIDCSTYVLAHELGHNMGLNHSRKQNSSGGTFDYALGYGVDNDFATVMAYSSEFNASKINLFSNPSLVCGSKKCGITRSTDQGADAVHTLNLVTPQIANYFTEAVTATDTWISGQLDSDGNGTSDIIMQHLDGDWRLNTMNGSEVLAVSEMSLINDPEWHAKGRSDYNGDGIADILLRNKNTGEWQVFIMRGKDVSLNSKLTMTGNLNWYIAGDGDFDGDGKGDVLLRNTDGRWYLYYLDGTRIKSTSRPALPVSLDYAIASVGDYDGDGKSDIILRNSDGGWGLFTMDGGDVKSSGQVAIKKSADWQPMASGDFNGDEKDDLLMRYKNGSWLVYQFDGFDVSTSGFLEMTNDIDWKVASTGDFNGDGITDILIRNELLGSWMLYTMNQSRIKNSLNVALTEDLSWLVPSS
jgi:hypothetical protein